jgi:acetyl-CoA carboxylase biotin carboxyl carrier protein
MTDHDHGDDADLPAATDHDHDADGNVVVRSVSESDSAEGAGPDAVAGADAGDDPGMAAQPEPESVASARSDLDPGDTSLLALIDRLGSLLDRSELSELAVEAGGTRLVLRKPAAIAPPRSAAPGSGGPETGTAVAAAATLDGSSGGSAAGDGAAGPPAKPSVKAPLTGVWYSSPAPGSAPFVAAGREVAVGQVIGLIEAMKLFNEIKSDLAGRVVKVVAESGSLVKAKQPLIEVEPL